MATQEIIQEIQRVMAAGGEGGPVLLKPIEYRRNVEVFLCVSTGVEVLVRDPQTFTHPKLTQVVVSIPLSLSQSMTPYVINNIRLIGPATGCHVTVLVEGT